MEEACRRLIRRYTCIVFHSKLSSSLSLLVWRKDLSGYHEVVIISLDDKMTFHLSKSLLPLVRILAMNLHFLDGLALPSALSLLFGKPPSLWGCMNITQHERNSPLISAHNLPMQRTPYATYTHTHTNTDLHRLHPGVRCLGAIFSASR